MLEYGDVGLFAQFLINIGFGDQCGQTEYNYNIQYRALRVLQNIVDTTTLEELTKQDICTFRYINRDYNILLFMVIYMNYPILKNNFIFFIFQKVYKLITIC